MYSSQVKMATTSFWWLLLLTSNCPGTAMFLNSSLDSNGLLFFFFFTLGIKLEFPNLPCSRIMSKWQAEWLSFLPQISAAMRTHRETVHHIGLAPGTPAYLLTLTAFTALPVNPPPLPPPQLVQMIRSDGLIAHGQECGIPNVITRQNP